MGDGIVSTPVLSHWSHWARQIDGGTMHGAVNG